MLLILSNVHGAWERLYPDAPRWALKPPDGLEAAGLAHDVPPQLLPICQQGAARDERKLHTPHGVVVQLAPGYEQHDTSITSGFP